MAAKRFEVLSKFRETNASIGLHVMPIIPYLTDFQDNFEELCSQASNSSVDYLLPGTLYLPETLYLRVNVRTRFFDFIQKESPEIEDRLRALYKTGGAGNPYKEEMHKALNKIRDMYNLSDNYMKPMKERLNR